MLTLIMLLRRRLNRCCIRLSPARHLNAPQHCRFPPMEAPLSRDSCVFPEYVGQEVFLSVKLPSRLESLVYVIELLPIVNAAHLILIKFLSKCEGRLNVLVLDLTRV